MNKQDLENKIKELEKQLTELKEELNEPESKVFKPKIGDTYYSINGNGETIQNHWNDDRIDNMRYAIGNYFRIEEEAKFEVERLKVVNELKRFAEEHNEPIDWNNTFQSKYAIRFNVESECFIDFYTASFEGNDIYFSSKEIAEQAVETIGEERIKKYYLGVEG